MILVPDINIHTYLLTSLNRQLYKITKQKTSRMEP